MGQALERDTIGQAALGKQTGALAEIDGMVRSEALRGAVDTAGLVDPTPISDLLGAGMSLYSGDFVGAGMSLVSCIPYVGDAVGKTTKGARAMKRLAALKERAEKAVEAIKKIRMDSRKRAAEAVKAKRRKEAAEQLKKKKNCKQCPEEINPYGTQLPTTGKWDGQKGNSRWTSDDGKYSVDYKDGHPDFSTAKGFDGSPILKDRVDIEMTGADSDFRQARDAMRDKTGNRFWPGTEQNPSGRATAPDGYTWHHSDNGTTMELVRSDVHDKAISGAAHSGGASIVKSPEF